MHPVLRFLMFLTGLEVLSRVLRRGSDEPASVKPGQFDDEPEIHPDEARPFRVRIPATFDPDVPFWVPWADAPDTAPAQRGVYLLRSLRCGPDGIVYIGKAANRGGLRQRLRQYRSPGHSNWTSIRVRDLCAEDGFIEVGWIVQEDAGQLEGELLTQYLNVHGRLPPWNRAQPRV